MIINDTVTNLLACVGLTVIVVIFLFFITTLIHIFSMSWDIWRYKKSKNKDNEIILYDYEISDDCCNEDSFGYVCLKCGQCGRKFANGMLQKEGADNGKVY